MNTTKALASKYPIFDGHNDVMLDLVNPDKKDKFSFLDRSDYKHLDLPRAIDAGFMGGLFALMVPDRDPKPAPAPVDIPDQWAMPYPDALNLKYSQDTARTMIQCIHDMAEASGNRVKVVTSVEEIEVCFQNGTIAMGIHFEGAEPIAPDLHNLSVYYDQGLRSVGIVWSRPNAFARGVPIQFPGHADHGPGLTDAGKELVRTCNKMGIMIDLSHLNEKGFWDVAELSDAPLVATHSNAHALCPSSRNLTDQQLDAIGASGGLVGINFAVYFLRKDGKPEADTPIDVIIDHIGYISNRIGVEHVALGSDFNGAMIPAELGDVMGLPCLIKLLEETGYSSDDIRKITSENWLRVLRETWH